MKALNKGAPSMGQVARQSDQKQKEAVQRVADPVAYMENQKQGTLLGGGSQPG